MSLYPSSPDIFVDRTGANVIASSDPNNAYAAIENLQNFIGASGEAQSKSVTLLNMFRSMLAPIMQSSYIGVDTISVAAGQIALFSGSNAVFKRNAAATTCNLSVDLLNGSEAATTWYDLYVIGDGANSAFTLGFLGQGTDPALYATYYKKIFGVRNDGSSNITKFYLYGNDMMWDVPAAVTAATTDGAWSGAISCTDAIPSFSTLGIFGLQSENNGAGVNLAGAWVRPNGGVMGTNYGNGIVSRDSGDFPIVAGQRRSATDEAQQIQFSSAVLNNLATLYVEGYVINL